MAEPTSPTTFPLIADELTALVMQRLRTNPLMFLPLAPVIAEFCGIRLEPIGAWFVDPTAKPLGGIMTLKLWYFQQQAGLDCPEIAAATAASPYGTAVGKLLAYGVIDAEQARALCGGVKDGAVLRAARGGRVMSPQLTLNKLQSKYGDDLRAATEMLQEDLGKHRPAAPRHTSPAPAAAPLVTPPRPAQSADPLNGVSRDELIDLVIARLGLTPDSLRQKDGALTRPELIRDIAANLGKAFTDATFALEVLTPEEQACLRRLVGEDTLFNLKNALAALSGSRAHQLTQGA